MPTLENMTDQEWRLGVLIPDPTAPKADPIEVVIPLDRAVARKAWEDMDEAQRAELPREPIVKRDLANLAKDAKVDPAVLLGRLRADALVRAALADGRLVLTEG
jgi:hypothetical protein